MSRRFMLFALVVVTAFLGTGTYSVAQAQAPSMQLDFWMKHGDTSSVQRDYLDVYVYVRSVTDEPVKNVAITIANCQYGQVSPFHIARTRHLVPGQEKLKAQAGGDWLEWDIASTPTRLEAPLSLHLKIKVDHRKGGPFDCIHGQSLIDYQPTPTVVELIWLTSPNTK